MKRPHQLLIVSALIAAGAPAAAQSLLDHNKALTGGSLPGDAPGYPITLTQPGSYKLMGNLVVPSGSSGISIQADGVTLDLNGFRIVGTETCSFNASTHETICSKPAVMTDGAEAVVALDHGRVESVIARHNAVGLRVYGAGAMLGVQAQYNEVDLKIHVGAIESAVAAWNGIAVSGALPAISSLLNGHASCNQRGVVSVALHGNRISHDKTGLLGTAAH